MLFFIVPEVVAEPTPAPPVVPPRVLIPVEDDEGSLSGSRVPPPPPRSPRPNQNPRNPLFPLPPVPARRLEDYSWYCGSIDTAQAKRVLQGKPVGAAKKATFLA